MNTKPTKPALLLTPPQTAEALAISPRKLWGMTATGEIPHIRLGRCVRYPMDDLQQWITELKTGVVNKQLNPKNTSEATK